MFKRLLLSALLYLSLFHLSFAQIESKSVPSSFKSSNFLSTEIPTKILPTETLNIPHLLEQDRRELEDGMPLRFAHVFEVDYNLDNSGQWETLANGDRVWRLTIYSPDALNLNFGYNKFFMPKGAYFHIYNEEKTVLQGAFTAKNNRSYRQFATRLIEADKVTLEYFEPAQVTGQGELSVSRVGHGYRDLDSNNGTIRSGSCQVNINCPEGNNWQTEKKGVARVIMEQAFLCSGTLINNVRQDFTPYFSIANHCTIGTGHDAITNPGVPLFIFYWNYECLTPLCVRDVSEDGCSSQDQTTQGGNIVASSGGPPRSTYNTLFGDFALILLDDNPKDEYNVYFNGFDRRGPDQNYAPSECIGIHHPTGDEKKIATDINGANQDETDDNYWKLFWESTLSGHSITEAGSSGSPLFDKNTKRVIGQLFGGSSNDCVLPEEDTGLYGGFYYSWENLESPTSNFAQRRLKDWLDPDCTGTLFVNGLDPNDTVENFPTVSFSSPSSIFEEESEIDDNCYSYKDYMVEFKITKAPSTDATVTIFVENDGVATAGSQSDFEILNNTLVFTTDGNNNNQFVTIRIYDDPIVEDNPETFVLNYTLDANNGNTIETPANHRHSVRITDNDKDPSVGVSLLVTLLSENFSGEDFSIWQILNISGNQTNQWILGEQDTNIGSLSPGTTVNAGMDGDCAYITNDAPNARYDYSNTETNTILFTAIDATERVNIEVSFIWACLGEDEGNPTDYALLVYSLNGTDFIPVPNIGHFSSRPTATGLAATMVTLPTELENQNFFLGFQWINNDLITSKLPIAIDNVLVTAEINQNTEIRTATNNSAPAQEQLDAMTKVHFYDPVDNSIMMTIENQSDFDFNCTDVFVDRSGTDAVSSWQNNKETTEKTFQVNPINNATNKPYKITLYYTKAEIDGWVANNTKGNDRTVLKIIKTVNSVATQDGSNFEVVDAQEEAFGEHYTYSATFNSGFSGFALGNLEAPALSTSFVDLKAQSLKNSIQLKWTTTTEQNNKGFYIQRATNLDEGFENITWIDGKGTTNQTMIYEFEDKNIISEQLYYYRLQQMDFDGQKTTSAIVSAIVKSDVTVVITPNPARHVLWINMETKNPTNGQFKIIDMLGRIVYEANLTNDIKNLIPVDVSTYTNGVYILQIFNQNNLVHISKFVKE